MMENKTVKDLQKDVQEMVVKCGFEDETVEQLFMLLIEEVGELARAARKHVGIKMAEDTHQSEIAEESADVFLYLLDICNHFDVDLGEEAVKKMKKNIKRYSK